MNLELSKSGPSLAVMLSSEMAKWEHELNDGWDDIEYDFGIGDEGNKRVSKILNEACHVFFCHGDGHWKAADKDSYASLLAKEFQKYDDLSGRVIRSNDRVVKMVAFRALELLKEAEDT